MVEMALDMLSAKKIVELDADRAALVSNLMVVQCSERDTQPISTLGHSSSVWPIGRPRMQPRFD